MTANPDKTLAAKLGYRPGQRAMVIDAPRPLAEFLGGLPDGVDFVEEGAELDLVHLFCPDRASLAARLEGLAAGLAPAGMLWVSWPKRGSGRATDLDGNVVRSLGLAAGLVDVKVCSVDAVWSGLKFVRRLRDRAPRGRIG